MIHYSQNTVFDIKAQTIVNTINCVGVMGGGLALEFKLRFPEMHQDYLLKCQRQQFVTGEPQIYKESKPWILNFPTKRHWKFPSKLSWIKEGLQYFQNEYKDMGIKSIAFPRLGCDRGGLSWDIVHEVMLDYLSLVDIDVFICLDKEPASSGVEAQMIESVKNTKFLRDVVSLNEKSIENIRGNIEFKRFRDIAKIRGIGKKTYEKIFIHAYSYAMKEQQNNVPEMEQLSLFQ
ncbi:hypothetical protein AWQ21_00065 [Picosynechococcus sp. PCC 7003]|uniref:macro domain-containing protein n=1 Tax=Picosynechococcus sp. PCC 7003 TaxID=374981 RepID=UPI000810C4ED|nr:macro domain-containing protein [Picosynechococcus sp. PCC 7003]ANV82931.1 hypothetical protein AWQ21_00065 [Picosynechococcus sp. PCC 7003]